MRQYSLFPMLFPFSYLGVLITGPCQWATLSLNTIVLDLSPLLTIFHSFLTHPDPYQIQLRQSLYKHVNPQQQLSHFLFYTKTFCFIYIWPLWHFSCIPDTSYLPCLPWQDNPVLQASGAQKPLGNWVPAIMQCWDAATFQFKSPMSGSKHLRTP